MQINWREGKQKWSRRRDLNPRPGDYKSPALPLSYGGIFGIFTTFPAFEPPFANPLMVREFRSPNIAHSQ